MQKIIFYVLLLVLLLNEPAHAYIGPGVGAGAIAVVLGVLASIFFAFVAILWYPIKRLIKALRAQKKTKKTIPSESE